MGRIATPTYRVELRSVMADGRPVRLTDAAWDSRSCGRPTAEHLVTWVTGLIASTRPGGVNAQLGELNVGRARVVRQADGEVVAEYVAPLFQVMA